MNKTKITVFFLSLGLFAGAASLSSVAFANDSVYATNDNSENSAEKKKDASKFGGVFSGMSEGDLDYIKAQPNEGTSELSEIDKYYITMPTNMKYDEFNGYSNYSFNPDTNPISRAGSDVVDIFIAKLQNNSLYSETGQYKDNENPERYILGVDTSTREASSIDLLALAQDIQKKTGIRTLVYTVNHYTNKDIKGKNVLMFSDYAEIAKEVQQLDNASKPTLTTKKEVEKKQTVESENTVISFIPIIILVVIIIVIVPIVRD